MYSTYAEFHLFPADKRTRLAAHANKCGVTDYANPAGLWRPRPPPPPHRLGPGPPVSESDLTLLEAAVDSTNTYCFTLGLPTMRSIDTWTPADDELTCEITNLWPQDGARAAQLDLSATHNVVRLITVLDGRTLVRLITPYNVWAHVLDHGKPGVRFIEPEPTPITEMPTFAVRVHYSSMAQEQAEPRMLVQHLLSRASGGEEDRQAYHIHRFDGSMSCEGLRLRTHYTGGATVPHANCPGCQGDTCRASDIRFTISRHWRTMHITCTATASVRNVTLSDDMLSTLFDFTNPREPPKPTYNTPTPRGMSDVPVHPPPPLCPDHLTVAPGKAGLNNLHNSHGLVIAQVNLDKTARHQAHHILRSANKWKADILLLQDVANCNWSDAALLENGWISFTHRQCKILLRATTVGRLARPESATPDRKPMVWRSDKHNSIAVTLLVPGGTLMVANAYFPPDIDSFSHTMGSTKREAVADQHAELQSHADRHTHSHMSFDGNETITARGRVQIQTTGGTKYSGNAKNCSLQASTMSCHAAKMLDCHRHLHDNKDGTYPDMKDMTNVNAGSQANGIKTIQSKIDYSLCSKSLAPNLTSCRIDHSPKAWAQKPRTNYHAAIITGFEWEGLWNTTDPLGPKAKLKGKKTKNYPNYRKLNKETGPIISHMVQTELRERFPNLRGIWKGQAHDSVKRDQLLHVFKATILKAAYKVLGTAHPSQPTKQKPNTALAKIWDELVDLVRRALRNTLHSYVGAPISLDGPEIEELRNTFTKHGVDLPTTATGWRQWWNKRDDHKADILHPGRDIELTDHLATTNPKAFFAQATRPFSSSKIPSLRTPEGIVATDAGIEHCLTEYLQNMGSPPSPESEERMDEGPDSKTWKNKRKKHKQHLSSMMMEINEHTMIRMVGTLKTSAAGYDGITPALLKAVLTTTWQEPRTKTDADRLQESLDLKFNASFKTMRTRLGLREGTAGALRPIPLAGKTRNVTCNPNLTRAVFRRILNLCLSSGDIPLAEKHGITTGLPKSEGTVTSTNDIRPISVGPAITRLLNKILADRLSSLLTKHSVLDKAQFSFLPGRDIHEPISSALACYRDRKAHDKNCYAVYYDISKAYDTIRWPSIKRAMEYIGLGEDFVSFIMATLKGTTLSMRTNRAGHVTPAVEMHKAIKQGCPIAPLLFIIVMDELHCALRDNHEGYALGTPTNRARQGRVVSRGYCDDTCIFSNNLVDLRSMNKTVHAFFNAHGLIVSEKKTKVTGRHAGGTPFTDSIIWPGTNKPFTIVPPDKPIKHLGALITVDLTWTAQINKMNASVMMVVDQLKNGRLTTLQATSIVKYVSGPKMEIGMRHADIPIKTLTQWDTYLSRAISKRANLSSASLHSSGVESVCRLTPLAHQYDIIKASYAMELLTRPSELREHYSALLSPIVKTIESQSSEWNTKDLSKFKPATTAMPCMAEALKRLAMPGKDGGLRIHNNSGPKGSRAHYRTCKPNNPVRRGRQSAPDPLDSNAPQESPEDPDRTNPLMATFNGISIPTWFTHDLWGSKWNVRTALADAVEAETAPPRVLKLAARLCKATPTSYHHPDCCAPQPASGVLPKITTLLCWAKGSKRKPNTTCKSCKNLWKEENTLLQSLAHAIICTDGSTFDGKPSAAAFVFADDHLLTNQLWDTPGYYWKIAFENNYLAEMAAIHKGIRSVPANVGLTIHTDSLSSIQAIESALRCPERFKALRCAGRPYILAILAAIEVRSKLGASTTLKHVRSHTGGRDKASVGNAEADRLAKWEASTDTPPDSCINMMQNDLKFVLCNTKWTTGDKEHPPSNQVKPIHGDVRKDVKEHMASWLMEKWGARKSRGELARTHPKETTAAIKQLWTQSPSSSALHMGLVCLNQVTSKIANGADFVHEHCARCGTLTPATPMHVTQTCPCNTPELNELDDTLDAITGIPHDTDNLQTTSFLPYQRGPLPSSLTDRVEANRRTLTRALREGPMKANPAALSNRGLTIHIPTATSIDTILDIGQIALLHTLYAHTTSNPTPPPLPPLPLPPPPPPALSPAQGPNPVIRTANQAGTLGNNYFCFDCGGLGPITDTCPLHKVCLRHRMTSHDGSVRCKHCLMAKSTPQEGPHTLRDITYRILAKTLATPHHYHSPALRQACRLVLRTHSDLHFNPMTAPSPWDAVWHTDDINCTALGGTYHASPLRFLVNRFTWIGPSNPQEEICGLQTALVAIGTSTKQARAVLLAHDTVPLRKEIDRANCEVHVISHPCRAHIIATIAPGKIELTPSNSTISTRHETQTNTQTLVLVLIENSLAPGFSTNTLHHALEAGGATPAEPLPWSYPSLPPDTRTGPIPPLQPRNHPLQRPSQSWFRGDIPPPPPAPAPPPGPRPPRPPPADSIPQCLAVMGATPKGLAQALSQHHEDAFVPDGDTTENISKIIYNKSLTLFRKDEAFRKWKRKHRR